MATGMAFVDKLKEAYFRLEDKWYDLLDALDQKKIPVYKVVDALESRNIPSFPVAIASTLIILALLVMFLPGLLVPQSSLTLNLIDEDGRALSDVALSVSVEGQAAVTGVTDDRGTATFTVPLNSEVTVTAVKAGFEDLERTITATRPSYSQDLIMSAELTALTKTIRLKSVGSGIVITDPVTVSFSCSNRYDYTKTVVVTGEVTLEDIPLDCGNLYVVPQKYASSQDYVDLSLGGAAELLLSAVETVNGNVIVVVKDEQENALAGMVAKLYTSKDSFYDSAFTGASGAATFNEVPVDSYYVTVSDETGVYETYYGTEDVKAVLEDETTTFNARMKKGVIGKIRLRILDRFSNLPIANAQVILSKSVDGVTKDLATPAYTGPEGKVEIAVADAGLYDVRIDHSNYLIGYKKGVARTAEGVFTDVFLTEATAENSRTLEVTVVDERDYPISGVKAKLIDAATQDVVGVESSTGANGKVSFTRLDAGSYQVHIYKPGFGEKLSSVVDVVPRELNSLKVVLPLGTGTLEVEVLNQEEQPVPGAVIGVYDVFTRQAVGPKELVGVDGKKAINLRADAKAFVVVEAEGYANYTSIPVQMGKDVTKSLQVKMVEDIPKLEIVFEGLYVEGELVRDYLNPGAKYTARFQLQIPKGSTFDEIGVHLRTGEAQDGTSNILENDPIYIKEIISAADKTVKGTSYTPANGYATDVTHLTNGAAKWAEAVWFKPGDGVFEVEAEVLVRQAETGSELRLDYRGWGQLGTYVRNPTDAELGNRESSGSKGALYANAKTAFYSLGPSNICAGDFCSILSVEDLFEGIETAVIDAYAAKVQNNYRLFFTISNASENFYDNVQLRLVNDTQSLSFTNYKAIVRGREESGALNAFEHEIEIGSFEPNEVVFGELSFRTAKDGASPLRLELVSNREKVMEKEILVDVEPAKEMTLDLVPKNILPYVRNHLVLRVLDAESESGLGNTLVKIYVDNELMATGNTDAQGEFEFEMGAPRNGSTLRVEAEKNSYKTLVKSVAINENILNFTPSEFQDVLVTTGVDEKEFGLVLSNDTEIPLIVKSVRFSGDQTNLLSISLDDDYTGLELDPDEDYNLSLTFALTDRGKRLDEPAKAEGSIDITLYNDEYSEWVTSIPYSFRIGFGNQLEAANCLVFSVKKWDIVTGEEARAVNLGVKNNCTVNGNKVDLRGFSVKVDNGNDNELGVFQVEGDLLEKTVAVSKDYQELSDVLPAGYDGAVTLTFLPKDIESGKSAPKLIFKAVNKTAQGDEVIEFTVNSSVQVNNLAKCVKLKGADNLVIETCPYNTGWGNYTSYSPSTSYKNYPSWVVQANRPSAPYGTTGYPSSSTPSTYEMQQYQYRNPSLYTSSPYLDTYNQSASFGGGWACSQASFRIQNTCNVPVQVNLEAHPFLNVPTSEFTLSAGQDSLVKVGESIRIGNYPITVEAKVKGSEEASVEVDTAYVRVMSPTEVNNDCIVLAEPSDGVFHFGNSLIVKPVKAKLINNCFDSGVRLTQNSVTTQSFGGAGGSATLITSVRAGTPYEQVSGGKTVQILEFEIDKDLSHRQKQDFPDSSTPVEWGLNLRAWVSAGYNTVEERRNMVVNYQDAYQQPHARNFLITFRDYWRAGEFDILQWGDVNAVPQDCINNINDVLTGAILTDTLDYVYTPDPIVLKIGDKKACGQGDRLSNVTPSPADIKKYSDLGVELSFKASGDGKNVIVYITRVPGKMKNNVQVNLNLSARVERLYGKSGRVNITVSLMVHKEGLVELTEQEAAALAKGLAQTSREAARAAAQTACQTSKIDCQKVLAEIDKAVKFKREVTFACDSAYGTGYSSDPEIKLLFDWEYAKVAENACDEAYCDAVQFGIELSKKQAKAKAMFEQVVANAKLETKVLTQTRTERVYTDAQAHAINPIRTIKLDIAGAKNELELYQKIKAAEFPMKITFFQSPILATTLLPDYFKTASIAPLEEIAGKMGWHLAVNNTATEVYITDDIENPLWIAWTQQSPYYGVVTVDDILAGEEGRLPKTKEVEVGKKAVLEAGQYCLSDKEDCYDWASSLDFWRISKKQVKIKDQIFFLDENDKLLERDALDIKDLSDYEQKLSLFRDSGQTAAAIAPRDAALLNLRQAVNDLKASPQLKENLVVVLEEADYTLQERALIEEVLKARKPTANVENSFKHYLWHFDDYAEFVNALYACGKGKADLTKCPKEVELDGKKYTLGTTVDGAEVTVDTAFLSKIMTKLDFVTGYRNAALNPSELEAVLKNAEEIGLLTLRDGTKTVNYWEFYSTYASFDAKLMKDNYSEMFQNDFKAAFAQASDFDKWDFVVDGKESQTLLSEPGEHKVTLLYDIAGKTTAVKMDWASTPESLKAKNNVLYFLPFDLGVNIDKPNRDYGVGAKPDNREAWDHLNIGFTSDNRQLEIYDETSAKNVKTLAGEYQKRYDEVQSGSILAILKGEVEEKEAVACEQAGGQCIERAQCADIYNETPWGFRWLLGNDQIRGCQNYEGKGTHGSDLVCCEQGYATAISVVKTACEKEGGVCAATSLCDNADWAVSGTGADRVRGCDAIDKEFICCERGAVNVKGQEAPAKACDVDKAKNIPYAQAHGVTVRTLASGTKTKNILLTWTCENGTWTLDAAKNNTQALLDWKAIQKEQALEHEQTFTFIYSPSYPTPVGLKTINTSTRDAFIGYNLRSSLGVNAEKELGSNILFRQGKDRFIDWLLAKSSVTPALAGEKRLVDYSGVPKNGLIIGGTLPDKCNDLTTNGLYWEKPKLGALVMQAMVFTPMDNKGQTPFMQFSNDCTTINAELFGLDLSNKPLTAAFDPTKGESDNLKFTLPLYDVTGAAKGVAPANNPQIASWKGIIEAANAGKLCVKTDRESADFKWNPQEVYSEEFQKLVEAR